MSVKCETCDGTGQVHSHNPKCWDCNGKGVIQKPSPDAVDRNCNKKYRVFIAQVNRQMIEVDAANENEAREKGYRKWRRDHAHSHVEAVEKCE